MTELSCFKAYDIRGEVNVNIDENIIYRIGRSLSQHFEAKLVVIGYDSRETSPTFASAIAKGVQDSGAYAMNIGLAGTEEMYWAVSEFDAISKRYRFTSIINSYILLNYEHRQKNV
ncbi:hypothetical protein OA410_01930 [Paracoccaceae bacterium]|nr:hypothetical protein [Paracoccaceae bacterium]